MQNCFSTSMSAAHYPYVLQVMDHGVHTILQPKTLVATSLLLMQYMMFHITHSLLMLLHHEPSLFSTSYLKGWELQDMPTPCIPHQAHLCNDNTYHHLHHPYWAAPSFTQLTQVHNGHTAAQFPHPWIRLLPLSLPAQSIMAAVTGNVSSPIFYTATLPVTFLSRSTICTQCMFPLRHAYHRAIPAYMDQSSSSTACASLWHTPHLCCNRRHRSLNCRPTCCSRNTGFPISISHAASHDMQAPTTWQSLRPRTHARDMHDLTIQSPFTNSCPHSSLPEQHLRSWQLCSSRWHSDMIMIANTHLHSQPLYISCCRGISIHDATTFTDSHTCTGHIFMQTSSKPQYSGVDKVWEGVLWSQIFLLFFLNFLVFFRCSSIPSFITTFGKTPSAFGSGAEPRHLPLTGRSQ